jgi:hypothetical protein
MMTSCHSTDILEIWKLSIKVIRVKMKNTMGIWHTMYPRDDCRALVLA